MHVGRAVGASLEEKHRARTGLAESRGDDAPGGTAAYDHNVEYGQASPGAAS
jgi:hypothetical protein